MKLRPKIKTEVLDIEFVEVDSQDVHQLCTACLCATRTTRTLDDDALKQYYTSIILHETQALDPRMCVRLCWECVALLRRSLQLRERATLSYNTLLTLLEQPDKESLTKLFGPESSGSEHLQACFIHSINILPDDDIKQMNADYDDDDVAAEQLPTFKEEILETEDNKDWNSAPTGFDCPNKLYQDRLAGDAAPAPTQTRDTLRTGEALSETENTPDTLARAAQCDTRYKCKVCSKTCRTEYGLTKHNKTHTTNTPQSFTCDMCSKTFKKKPYILKHMRAYHTEATSFRQCKDCKKKFSSAPLLSRHVCLLTIQDKDGKTIPTRKFFECNVCSKSFKTNFLLGKHQKSHTRPYQCHLCPKAFGQKCNLESHLMTHPGIAKRFICSVCMKGFAERRRMVFHMVKHHPACCSKEMIASAAGRGVQPKGCNELEKKYKCEFCPKKFVTQRLLNEHTRRHTEPPIQCDMCPKSFKGEKSLKNHMRSHTGEMYQCDLCPKSFTRRWQFTAHLRRHGVALGDATFMCEICSKTFTTKASMERHVKMHTRQKPYQCDECPKAYTEKYKLVQHKWRHSGERPYKCSLCPTGFFRKKYLTRHLHNHTKDKPKCGVCNKIFRYKSFLLIHMRSHTGEKTAVCGVCQRGFSSNRDLSRHMRGRHDIDVSGTRTHTDTLVTSEQSRDSSVGTTGN